MSVNKKVLLLELSAQQVLPGLAEALQKAGAEVRQMGLEDCDAVLDALEQGWMPVVLKAPAGG